MNVAIRLKHFRPIGLESELEVINLIARWYPILESLQIYILVLCKNPFYLYVAIHRAIQFSQNGHLQRCRDPFIKDRRSRIENVCIGYSFHGFNSRDLPVNGKN